MFDSKKPLPQIDPRLLMLFGLMSKRLDELQQEMRKTKKEILEAVMLLAK